MKNDSKVDHDQEHFQDAIGVDHDHVVNFLVDLGGIIPSQAFEAIHDTDKLSSYEKLYAAWLLRSAMQHAEREG
jgi:hypothetical protein